MFPIAITGGSEIECSVAPKIGSHISMGEGNQSALLVFFESEVRKVDCESTPHFGNQVPKKFYSDDPLIGRRARGAKAQRTIRLGSSDRAWMPPKLDNTVKFLTSGLSALGYFFKIVSIALSGYLHIFQIVGEGLSDFTNIFLQHKKTCRSGSGYPHLRLGSGSSTGHF